LSRNAVLRTSGPRAPRQPEVSGAERRAEIAYLMINFAPQWEAASKQITLLRQSLPAYGHRVVGFNTRGRLFRASDGVRKYPAPLLLLLPSAAVRALIGRHDVAHIFATAGRRLLLRVPNRDRIVLSMAKGGAVERVEQNIDLLRSLRFIVVETEQDRDVLRQVGVDGGAARLIYPGAPVKPYREATGPFTVVYATSPLNRQEMLVKGVYLLIRVAQTLPDVKFILAWRDQNYDDVRRLVREAGTANVEVRNGVLDMDEVYGSAHATILPALHRDSAKPCPQSLLDSMGHGKPVLVSSALPISGVLARNGAAAAFEPTVDAARQAILDLRDSYGDYQARCHATVSTHFSPAVFVERHRQIYEEILQG
jgi:glycosyltransferase involved in cell wall biosynthesis